MSKITISLLQSELSSWIDMKNSMEINVPKGKVMSFGTFMNQKYSFRDDNLLNEADHNSALLLIMRDHVQEIK